MRAEGPIDFRTTDRELWNRAMQVFSARLGTNPPGSELYDREVSSFVEELLADEDYAATFRRVTAALCAYNELAYGLLFTSRAVDLDEESDEFRGIQDLLDMLEAYVTEGKRPGVS